jgi:crossover junction endodeoxyribonuclease RusA
MILAFRVYGTAQPMGSKRAFVPSGWTRPIVTDSNRSLKSWQVLVREAANTALQQLPASERALLLDGVKLTIACCLPRPASLPKRVCTHIKAPDLDKLCRALGDALTGLAYRDDAQVVDLVASKWYARPGEVPHVDLRVEPSTVDMLSVLKPAPLFAGMER